MDLNYQIDLCLEKTCWVVDILPRQVEKDSSGQYFAVEACWRQPERLAELYRRFAERQTQRAHSADEIAAWISECGFDKISVFGDRTFDAPREDEMRLHFTAVKP